MKIKICGITKIEDALLAIELGAWALGFIFYPKSPRYIEPEKAKEIIEKIPKNIKTVGVFVNENLEKVEEIGKTTNISTYQLHGEENNDYCEKLSKEVIKAFRFKTKEELEIIEEYKNNKNIIAFLVDAFSKEAYGGTGHRADWDIAKEVKNYGNLILAGGINEKNINSAILSVNPYAIDLSSSIESEYGIKDHKKTKDFFEELKNDKNRN
ncbi:MAG: phosphoribosylanthranilate isomerase [Candidatus Sericytochromatia bacterium]